MSKLKKYSSPILSQIVVSVYSMLIGAVIIAGILGKMQKPIWSWAICMTVYIMILISENINIAKEWKKALKTTEKTIN